MPGHRELRGVHRPSARSGAELSESLAFSFSGSNQLDVSMTRGVCETRGYDR